MDIEDYSDINNYVMQNINECTGEEYSMVIYQQVIESNDKLILGKY